MPAASVLSVDEDFADGSSDELLDLSLFGFSVLKLLRRKLSRKEGIVYA